MIFTSQLGKMDGYSEQDCIKSIANHIRRMQEELEYRLSVLDSSNISEIDAETTDIITKDGNLLHIIDDQNGNFSRLEQGLNGLAVTVASNTGNIAQLQVTSDGLASKVENAEGSISTLVQGAKEIQAAITDLNGNVTSITANITGIQSTVSEHNTSISQLTQTSDGIQASVSDLTTAMGHTLKLDARGVYIVDQNGKTVSISGGQIKAGSITGNQIQANSITAAEIDASDLYVDAAHVTGTLVAGSLKGSNIALTTGNYTVGNMSLAYTTTGYGVGISSNYGGIQIESGGNIWLESAYGASLLLSDIFSIGAPIVLNTDNYGSSFPSNPVYGQLFFKLG